MRKPAGPAPPSNRETPREMRAPAVVVRGETPRDAPVGPRTRGPTADARRYRRKSTVVAATRWRL